MDRPIFESRQLNPIVSKSWAIIKDGKIIYSDLAFDEIFYYQKMALENLEKQQKKRKK